MISRPNSDDLGSLQIPVPTKPRIKARFDVVNVTDNVYFNKNASSTPATPAAPTWMWDTVGGPERFV